MSFLFVNDFVLSFITNDNSINPKKRKTILINEKKNEKT